jgi:hypothetical protein
VYFDDEIMQILQSLGIAEEIDAGPIKTYHRFGADGETIFRLQHPEAGPSALTPVHHRLKGHRQCRLTDPSSTPSCTTSTSRPPGSRR